MNCPLAVNKENQWQIYFVLNFLLHFAVVSFRFVVNIRILNTCTCGRYITLQKKIKIKNISIVVQLYAYIQVVEFVDAFQKTQRNMTTDNFLGFFDFFRRPFYYTHTQTHTRMHTYTLVFVLCIRFSDFCRRPRRWRRVNDGNSCVSLVRAVRQKNGHPVSGGDGNGQFVFSLSCCILLYVSVLIQMKKKRVSLAEARAARGVSVMDDCLNLTRTYSRSSVDRCSSSQISPPGHWCTYICIYRWSVYMDIHTYIYIYYYI